ncbi:MAG: B12-binding domain-containing radical SAM protein [Rectinemataceae bacterium]
MKLIFVQLPVQEPGWEGATANIPLAAGYLASYAESKGLLARNEWKILARDVADYASDSGLAEAIAKEEPDIVAFTLYAWNVERSMHVAARTAILSPRTRFIAGGPEVVEGMPIMERSPFNALVEGEGELPFARILEDVRLHRPLSRHYKADDLLDLSTLPNPYLNGAIPFDPEKPVHLETMRGCPSRCGYCYYGKNFPGIRKFSREDAALVIKAAGEAGVRELYLMDPSFQAAGDLEARLKELAAANTAGMALHAELRLESVTEELGALYREAGLASAEVGLQTVNPRALEAVGRTWDRQAFERGAAAMEKNHIVVKTGLILGLPFDGLDQVVETFDFLGMHGLGQDAELYPLSLLPGTEVREKADEWGMSRMDKPPYWVTSTDWISGDDMADAVAAFEESFDIEWASPPAPHFKVEEGGFRAFIDARKAEQIDWMRLNPGKLANSVTILADADDPESLSRLVRVSRDLRRDNPFTLYQLVLSSDTRIPSEKLCARVRDAFANPDHYYELTRFFSLDPQANYQTRLFFATRNPALAYRAMEEAQDLETMLVLSGKAGFNADRLEDLLPFIVFDRETIPFDRLYELLSIYAEFRHMLVEAPEDLF